MGACDRGSLAAADPFVTAQCVAAPITGRARAEGSAGGLPPGIRAHAPSVPTTRPARAGIECLRQRAAGVEHLRSGGWCLELQSVGSLANGMAIIGYLPPVTAANLASRESRLHGGTDGRGQRGLRPERFWPEPGSRLGTRMAIGVRSLGGREVGHGTDHESHAAECAQAGEGPRYSGHRHGLEPVGAGPGRFPRIFNTSVWMTTVKNPTPVLLQNTPIDVTAVIGLK